ncbi:MAG: arginine deiminase [Bacteroidetes bacterium]|nr:arginine deiminase [Bacteroidota bacterium]
MNKIKVNVTSEVGELEAVIIHTPGPEVENMTPKNAERALYSDILNLSEASKEYSQFKAILKKHSTTLEVVDLLCTILKDDTIKNSLLTKICMNEDIICIKNDLMEIESCELARQLLQGVPLIRENLTSFLSNERYSLRPLHNFFFTRDASIAVNENVLIGKMANTVREREAIIMEAIFKYHPLISTRTFNPLNEINFDKKISIEGGDILIAREDVLLVGNSARTTSEGIDYILDKVKDSDRIKHIIVQELPDSPESFIHLDMTFTFLSENEVMIYEPVILDPNRYKTIHINVENRTVRINEENNLLEALKKINFDLRPISCGGKSDPWVQEREQWHSGANFFAMGPGKLIGYGRNVYTLEEMNNHGYEIIPAKEIIKGKKNLNDYSKYVVTIDSSELSRGGGGCRCMTMPIARK